MNAYRTTYATGHYSEEYFNQFAQPETALEIHLLAAERAGKKDAHQNTLNALREAGFNPVLTEIDYIGGAGSVKPGENNTVLVQIGKDLVYSISLPTSQEETPENESTFTPISHSAMSFDKINEMTGFADGDTFASEQDVRAYFTAENMLEMFGQPMSQSGLDKMANIVIANGWHCEFVTAE